MSDVQSSALSSTASAELTLSRSRQGGGIGRTSKRTYSTAVWVGVRGSGLLLSILVLGHLLFVHILTDVSATNASFVARRWSSTLWVVWDGAMLSAAFLHGGIGMAVVVKDYVRGPLARKVCLGSVYIVCSALTVLGWYAIISTVLSSHP